MQLRREPLIDSECALVEYRLLFVVVTTPPMPRLTVTAKYAQPAVIEFWRRFSLQGLQSCELQMLARYAPPPARLLDLGCGGGRAGLALIPLGYNVTGLDLTWDMLIAARALHIEAALPPRFLQADLCAVPAAPAGFDAALIFIAALQHIPGRAARRAALAEIGRTLRPGGTLILALDNLAPALTCYAWWAWQKLAHRVGGRTSAVGPPTERLTPADALLEFNRRQQGGIEWHLRGVARTLRWRTLAGWVDAARRTRLWPGEVGDTGINQVSLHATSGTVYYHLYRHTELLDDARAAGFALLGYHSGSELNNGQTFAPRVRQLDKQVLYAFESIR